MLDLLVLTVVVPLLVACGILLWSLVSSGLEMRKAKTGFAVGGFVLAVLVGLSVIALQVRRGGRIALASLYPSLLVESLVELRWDATLWPLGLGLSVSVGAMLLRVGKSDERRLLRMAVALTLMSSGLASLWSANPLTTIISWAFYDMVGAIALIVAGVDGSVVARTLALGGVTQLLVWTGVLRAGGGIGSVQWALMPAGGAKMAFWMVAGLMRIGAYPFHVFLPRRIIGSSSTVEVLLLSPVLGWGLWARLAVLRGGIRPMPSWMVAAAFATAVGGAVLGWTSASAREGRRWISMGVNGVLLVGVSLLSLGEEGTAGGTLVSLLILGAVGWMLSTALMYLGGGLDAPQILQRKNLPYTVPVLVGALSLVGMPGTAGFLAASTIMTRGVGAGNWLWDVGFFVSQAFLVAGVVRWLLRAELDEPSKGLSMGVGANTAGLVGLAVGLIAVGIVPLGIVRGADLQSAPNLRSLLIGLDLKAWALWMGALLVGGAVARLEVQLHTEVSLWAAAVHDAVQLDWAYGILMGAFEQGFRLLRVIDDVVGGDGALLWATIILLLMILVGGV